MRFRNVFLWLKFTTITPSFYFKNRLFIERGLRVNNMYTYMGNTQKSFTWLPTSSSNLSLYWFRRRGTKLALLLLLLLLLVFFFFDFSHFTPWGNTQVVRALCYVFWRTLDCVFFFSAHFFVFSLATLTWSLRYLTNFASTKYWAWAMCAKNTVPNTLNPSNQFRNLYPVTPLLTPSSHSVPASLTRTPSEFTNNLTVELVGDLYRLLLVTAPTVGLPNLANTNSLPNLLLNPRSTSVLSSSTTHSCFFLQSVLPSSVPFKEYLMCVQDLNSLTGFYNGFLSPNSINFGYEAQGNNIRAVRWLFRGISSLAKDTTYVHNLLSGSLSRNLRTPFIGQEGTLNSANTLLAIEWFGFRSAYLARPFLIEPVVINVQRRRLGNPLTLSFTDYTRPGITPQQGVFLWSYWSDFFTNKSHLVLTWGNTPSLTKSGFYHQPTRRWL